MNEHAEWCALPNEAGECDCGGEGGRCAVCGAEGPCRITDDGVVLIHVPVEVVAAAAVGCERADQSARLLFTSAFGGAIGVLLAIGEWQTALIIAAVLVSTWRIAWPLEDERRKRAGERVGDS